MHIDYVVYTYGGGEQLFYTFNAIASLFNGHKVYQSTFYISAVMFGFWVLLTSIIKNEAMVPIRWMFWFWMSTNAMLVPKASILINDPITKFERKVDNVPYVLGAFAGIMSGIGHGITDTVETLFKIADYEKYSESGSMFASRLLKNMDRYRIRDGILKENISRFIDQCVVLEAMMGGKYTVSDLHHAENIWQLVRDNANPINGFTYREPTTKTADILTCKEGAKKLDKELTKHTKGLATYLGKQYKLDANSTTSDAMFENFFKEKLTNSFSFMADIANSAEDILKQEMMINAIDDVKQSYAVAKARIQQRQWHSITGELASHFLIALKIVLETLAYSAFIFIAILMMLPTGIVIFARYLQILIWLQLWAPLYAILNMVMCTVGKYQSKAILGGEGLTMLTSIGLSNLHADIEAIAAMCSASIPFISYALLQGSVSSFISLASTITGAMSGAAQSVSHEIASGNLSLNTVAYSGRARINDTGFKHDTSIGYKSGTMDMERLDGGHNLMVGTGRLLGVGGGGQNMSKLPDTISVNRMLSMGFNNHIAEENSIAMNHARNFEQHRSMAHQNASDLLSSMGRNIGQNRGWEISNSSQYADSINKTINFTKQLQETHGWSAKAAGEVVSSIGFGIWSVRGSASYSYGLESQEAKQMAESQGLVKHIEEGVRHLDDIKYNESMGEEKRLAESLRREFSAMEQSSQQYGFHSSEAKKWENAKTIAESLGIGITEDATERFVEYVAHTKNSDGSEVGRDRALQIAADGPAIGANRDQYMRFLGGFSRTIAEERFEGMEASGLISEGIDRQKQDHAALRASQERKLLQDVVDGKEGAYGKFQIEQAEIGLGQRVGIDQDGNHVSEVFQDAKEVITNTGQQYGLAINKDITSDDTQRLYRTYSDENNKEHNIVSEVSGIHKQDEANVKQQTEGLTSKKNELYGILTPEEKAQRFSDVSRDPPVFDFKKVWDGREEPKFADFNSREHADSSPKTFAEEARQENSGSGGATTTSASNTPDNIEPINNEAQPTVAPIQEHLNEQPHLVQQQQHIEQELLKTNTKTPKTIAKNEVFDMSKRIEKSDQKMAQLQKTDGDNK
ncbi:conjugal transfer protein TraG [Rickettsiales endosymbiont of Peranema trichophorum]|uniref:conjugal transfer protein TraG N-terminal domain-containing protein n=1 Tax=Rickettsiales endosymbiont of Peranema trichophorum TaxID=2486577 RepID=UPI0010232673|nr:conjugal transfer protein TraG N-terminal domain-containing protein [Rickettsiales endosymbiont of Peranema trichophorum]RZI47515.1 conjugal transfer protein TraG [Rickettsiales endosymbiont of Peranema trichophorum]